MSQLAVTKVDAESDEASENISPLHKVKKRPSSTRKRNPRAKVNSMLKVNPNFAAKLAAPK